MKVLDGPVGVSGYGVGRIVAWVLEGEAFGLFELFIYLHSMCNANMLNQSTSIH